MAKEKYDVVVVGAGPNGLAAAIALAREGIQVLVVEAAAEPGGGCRTAELTLPGFRHDVCSAVHPLGVASPFFRTLDLERHGLEWVHPSTPLAHVLGAGRVISLHRSVGETAAELEEDGPAYEALMSPLVEEFDALLPMILGPLRFPSAPVLLARFGVRAIRSMTGLARRWFQGDRAPALLGGISAHAMLPLDEIVTASFGLVLAAAGHAVGWPIARGGSGAIAAALVSCLEELGGTLQLGSPVESLRALPRARAYVLDVTPREALRIARDHLPPGYVRRLERFRYGPGVFKMDWALREPVPWRDPACRRAGTVHLGGDLDAMVRAEAFVHSGRVSSAPFVLFTQPSVFDRARTPSGMHTAWAYCHVPHGSDVDASGAIESQIERFAPGFCDLVLARFSRDAAAMERYNPNYVGGDINGGLSDARQLFFRPVPKLDPYATASPSVFFCSSSTPPGGGVHGMCGYWAARSVLAKLGVRPSRETPAHPEA